MLAALKSFNLILAFLLELCMLAVFAYWGYQIKASFWMKVVAAIAMPVGVAVIWGLFLSPKASVPLSMPVKLVGKLLVFAVAVWLLHQSGHPKLAWVFAIIVALNFLLIIVWKQRVALVQQ